MGIKSAMTGVSVKGNRGVMMSVKVNNSLDDMGTV